jgi:AAA-like domain
MNTSPPVEPTFADLLKVIDAAVVAQAKRRLRHIEVTVLRGAWQGQKYDQIASECGYAADYIKHDVGPKLWQLLSSSFGEKVNKNNVFAVVLHHCDLNTSLPQPVLPAEPPITAMPLHSKFYIERPDIEAKCFAEIQRPGALIRIKAPRQMGKTSLMIRILAHAKQQGTSSVHTVPLNLQQADQAAFSDLDQFLRWFCTAITRKLQLPNQVATYWSACFGSKSNCTAYFEDCILPALSGILVLAIDEVDAMFLHPTIASDFFALLRSWHEETAYGNSGNPLWQNLRLILVHSTEVYIPLDVNQSPFNVGLAIELKEFSPTQVAHLIQQYGLDLTDPEFLTLMQLLEGHPFLVQQALYHLSRQEMTFHELIQSAATDAGIYRNHLHRLLNHLQECEAVKCAFLQVMTAKAPIVVEPWIAFKLHSLGLVRRHKDTTTPSCQLYQQYFSSSITRSDNVQALPSSL